MIMAVVNVTKNKYVHLVGAAKNLDYREPRSDSDLGFSMSRAGFSVEIDTTVGYAPRIMEHKGFEFKVKSEFPNNIHYEEEEIPIPVDVAEYRDSNLNTPPIAEYPGRKPEKGLFLDPFVMQKYEILMQDHFKKSIALYRNMMENGIPTNCALSVLPLALPIKLFMDGYLNSWYNFCTLIPHPLSSDIVKEIKDIFCDEFPNIQRMLTWVQG